METTTLTAKKRDTAGTRATKVLRKEGFVPGVMYGHGEESVPLALEERPLVRSLEKNARILTLDFGDAKDQVLIKDLQWDTFGMELLHIDLIRVRMDEVVTMSVRLASTGRAKGIDEGGVLQVQRVEVRIRCIPTQIPEVIEYDVADLGIQESIFMRDLVLPEGVELDDDPDLDIASIVTKVEVVEETPEGEEAEGEGEEGAPEGEDAKDDAKEKKDE